MRILTEVHPIEILLVEDNPADIRLTREALKTNKLRVSLNTAGDGEKAIEYLRQEGEYSNCPRPDIILLDLNLPRKNGREVLAEIKSDPRFKSIPVVVLTMSKAEEDILAAYELHANCYITKPIDLNQFMKVVKTIEEFWFTIVKLPQDSTSAY